jgi:hypothetical protein
MKLKNLTLLISNLFLFVTTTGIVRAESLSQLHQNKAQQLGSAIPIEDSLGQVTNVSQLKDVAPTDWAYEALQSLSERYGCIAGYPNSTFRGNKPLNRYEFAAGLNSCMQQIERLVANNESVLREDLNKLQRLSQDFQSELASLGTKVDNLEGRTAFLEDNQFSTTTTLNGEVIFGVALAGGGDPPGGCRTVPSELPGRSSRVDCANAGDPDNNAVFTNLTRLGLQTSFSGKDRLRTYLTTGNFNNGGFTNPESLNTYMSRLSYQAGLENQVILDLLEYRFPIVNDKVVVSVIPAGFSLSNVLSANSPYFDTGRGSISNFGEQSPIFKLGGVLDAGVGFDWLIAKPLRLQVAYGTSDSSNPNGGFLGADRSAIAAQLLLQPSDNIVTGLTYVNAYTSDGRLGTFTGSINAESTGLWSQAVLPNPFISNSPDSPIPGVSSGSIELDDRASQTNAVGATLSWRLTDKLTFGAWGGMTFTEFLDELPEFSVAVSPEGPLPGGPQRSPSSGKKPFGNTATYLVSLGLSDPFGREGDLLAFLFGMPPKLIDAGPETQGASVPFSEISRRGEDGVEVTDNNPRLDQNRELQNWNQNNLGVKDEATSLHFEVFYRFKVSDNISITPGVFVVTNPGHIEDNDTLYVGTIRTTFRF